MLRLPNTLTTEIPMRERFRKNKGGHDLHRAGATSPAQALRFLGMVVDTLVTLLWFVVVSDVLVGDTFVQLEQYPDHIA